MRQLLHGSHEAVELWKLLSTREHEFAGEAMAECDSYSSLVLCNLLCASITQRTHSKLEPIVNYYWF